MRYLALAQVVDLHRRLVEATGGASGIRDLGALESALAQPKLALAGGDLYPTLAEKAAALCFRWWATIPFSTGTSVSATRPWQGSCHAPRSLPRCTLMIRRIALRREP
jgi:hypothetical protein